jgi:spermidine/putrescine transport system permease protein
MKSNNSRRLSLRGKLLPIFVILVFTVTYAPLIVMMIYSFNSPGHNVQIDSGYAHEYIRASEKWNGFSSLWYKRILSDKHLLRALVVSIIVTFTAVPVSIVIGTMTAFALYRFKFWGKWVFEQTLLSTLLIPEVVIGISLLLFFVGFLQIKLGIKTIFISHVAFTIPLVTLVVIARMQRMDPTLEEAAMDLGADEIATFRKVTLPLLMPAILAATLLAFPWSFNDFVISYFVAGPGSTTLPIYIYSMLKVGVSPVVNALGTVIVLFSIILVLGASLLQRLKKS